MVYRNFERRKKKTKKLTVVVHYEGCINYEVEAKNEEEAKELAERMFGDEDDRIIVAQIANVGACDCWEEKATREKR